MTLLLRGSAFFIFISLFCADICGQTVITGKVVDATTGEGLIGAAVVIEGTTIGNTTDIDGNFIVETSRELPQTLSISYLGYITKTVPATEANKTGLRITLSTDAVMMEVVEIKAQRISDKQQQAANSVETMDVLGIKEAASGSFYESLGAMKEVDVTSASLGFKVINTRGFNSTSPVRSLQLIDGVDNQSPGLNFSLGNFLGASDLDVKSVDIIAGASSAFYGPGAFNGVINMTTKDPFDFPGVDVELKVGERALFQRTARIADYVENKAGEKKFGYELNLFFMQANDWEAEDYRAIEGSADDESSPFGYDAVNIYGDEPIAVNNDNSDNLFARPGLTTFYRNGYRENQLVDYDTDNTKLSTTLAYRFTEDIELNYGLSYCEGNTIFQGDNRYALRDIEFVQNRLSLGKKDKWNITAYRTSEDAGNTYDIVTTAIRMQEAQGEASTWNTRFLNSWSQNILAQYPQINMAKDSISMLVGEEIANGQTDPNDGLDRYNDLMLNWIDINEPLLRDAYRDNVNLVNAQQGSQLDPFYTPGSARFDSLFTDVTSRTFTNGGSRFFDESALNHIKGDYNVGEVGGIKVNVGANFRMYRPDTRGTIFSDTLSYTYARDENGNFILDSEGERVTTDSSRVVIENEEWGAFLGLEKKFNEDKMTAAFTGRLDKNQNFDLLFSPALSFVYAPDESTTYRVSASRAIRNPTLADQYFYYNVGRAILLGNVDGRFEAGEDSLFTIESFGDYRNDLNTDTLDYFNVDAIRPEKVITLEGGYRGKVSESVYIDASAYYSRYTDFIGFLIGINGEFRADGFPEDGGLQVFRVAANAESTVITTGVSLGFNYYFKNAALKGNYSYNNLISGSDDPIIPAFNTPRNKFNLGISARELTIFKKVKHFGYGVNYKWIQGFLFEGSPQFTGSIPTYDMVDAQVNIYVPTLKSRFKIGGSNILGLRPLFDSSVQDKWQAVTDNRNLQVYGGPRVGRLLYASWTIELK